MSSYQSKLLDPRWQRKKADILGLAGWQCETCNRTDHTLHVHHKYYEQGREPWDYPQDAFKVLCDDCHEQTESAITELRKVFGCFDYWQINSLCLELQKAYDFHPPAMALEMMLQVLSSIQEKEQEVA